MAKVGWILLLPRALKSNSKSKEKMKISQKNKYNLFTQSGEKDCKMIFLSI